MFISDSASTYGLELAEDATGFSGGSQKSAHKDTLFILNTRIFRCFQHSFCPFSFVYCAKWHLSTANYRGLSCASEAFLIAVMADVKSYTNAELNEVAHLQAVTMVVGFLDEMRGIPQAETSIRVKRIPIPVL